MKRYLALVITCIFVPWVDNVEATYYFRWDCVQGEALSNSGTWLPSGRTMLTFMSPDATISWSSNWLGVADGGDYGASGNDTFLFAANTTGLGGGYYRTVSYSNIPLSSPLYIYGVLVDVPYATFVSQGGVLDGTYFDLTSQAYQLLDRGTPPGTQQDITDGLLRTQSQISVVPEPTTLALIATGMGVVLVRRRKKQATGVEESA
jgi:hypothetical protein